MARSVSKAGDNMYALARLAAGFRSREEAAEGLPMCPRTLAKIELDGLIPTPDQVIYMADRYDNKILTARYCAEQCPIGQKYAYHVEQKDLATTVLGILKEYNDVQFIRDKLIEITADGVISEDEKPVMQMIIGEFMDLEKKIESLKILAAEFLPIEEMIQKRKEKTASRAAM